MVDRNEDFYHYRGWDAALYLDFAGSLGFALYLGSLSRKQLPVGAFTLAVDGLQELRAGFLA